MESHSFFSYGHNRLLGTIILALIVIALAAYAHLTLREARYINIGPTTINVVGVGEVLAVPDIGQFSFAVLAEGDDAAMAQTASAEAINEILAYLSASGVEERDVKTENYNLNPNYRYDERICANGNYCPPGERVLDGYEVSQNVSVKVRDLDKAGTLISGVGERGATNISSLQFTVDDDEALKAEARAAAIANAKENANALAADLGVRIVRMIGFWEEQGYPEPYYGYGGDMMVEKAVQNLAPDLPVGENKTTSRVNITYEVQ